MTALTACVGSIGDADGGAGRGGASDVAEGPGGDANEGPGGGASGGFGGAVSDPTRGGAGGSLPAGGGTSTAGGSGTPSAGGSGGAPSAGGSGGAPSAGDGGGAGASPPQTRDATAWPFAAGSIWNMPVGSAAVYVPATIKKASHGVSIDEDIIVLRPNAPSLTINTSDADWDNTKNRCPATGGPIMTVPVPDDYVFKAVLPDTPNAGLAVLLADGHTIKQTQPFSRCAAGQAATSHYTAKDVDLYTDGTLGAHGGSGLSAIGGTLRVGELRPASGAVRHVLKVELWKRESYYACVSGDDDCRRRWPAISGESNTVGGTDNAAMKEGSLLALPASLDLDSLGLRTEPAKRLAWTLQNYGGYVVDDTAWSRYSFAAETGPDGNFQKQFAQDWGFAFGVDASGESSPWVADMDAIFAALAVVDNNGPTSVGGGGTPRQPLAPPFASAK